MLFPSFQEGLGWPILEAQACGCPVATSGRSPMNEVGGDAAIYIDPDSPASADNTKNIARQNVDARKAAEHPATAKGNGQ